jgi:hypothetical protein
MYIWDWRLRGYNLANPNRADSITGIILAQDWERPILDYFRWAYIGDGRVNPYWPRASILTAVGILTDNIDSTRVFPFIHSYVTSLRNVSVTEKDEQTIMWAASLPEKIQYLRSCQHYQIISSSFREAIRREVAENRANYNNLVKKANTYPIIN